ncbi:hypothetical protein PML95_05400 [Vagococcus lutrae]|uniref:Apea-like HEPN domain-containing protein n=1 Tax=Vagococcus lutrae TaxID=81947 RepID=A0AAF0BHE4_9ENTE|nr:hypothetical protein [Vagococcus lutrae]WCG21846.1 hypothetical protein PML95_05400 [Vagococcus lutrae]
MMIAVKNLSILLSTGMWLVKDSNIQPMYIYLTTSVNNYISVFNVKLDYSNSSGKNSQITINENDIKNCKKMMDLLYNPLLDIKNSENKKPTQLLINQSSYYEVNRNLSTVNPSFTKTLMLIQEARNTSFLASKIDKYIAAIQCVFAVKDNFTFNCSRITAAYISNNSSENKEILEFISNGYYIRSQVSHGKQVDEKKFDIEKISNRLDSYIRRIMKKVLVNSDLNYFSLEEEQKVRNYFKEIARRKFEMEYAQLKQSNRLNGIKKNIEGIKDLDTLLDLETKIIQQMDKLK